VVELTPRSAPGPVLLALGLLTGAVTVAIGVGLLTRVDTAFGAVWAIGLVLMGLVVVGSWLANRARPRPAEPPRPETLDGEPARFHPRRSTTGPMLAITGVLGVWSVAVAVVGAVEETWLWLVLAGVPAVYLLGFPVLWASRRFRPAGVWVTSTRIVDEHYGQRSELALADIAGVSPRTQTLNLTPREGVAVVQRRLTPRPWRARGSSSEMVIETGGLDGGSAALAQELLRRRDGSRH
jgi:hypothetical protein